MLIKKLYIFGSVNRGCKPRKTVTKDINKKVLTSFLTYQLRFAAPVVVRILFRAFLMILTVTEKSMLYAASKGKEYYDAFLFTVSLRSFHHHPVILDFNRRMAYFRNELNMGDERFRKLLKSAIGFELARYEGNHLHMLSKTGEERLTKSRNRVSIALEELKQFFYHTNIKHYIKQQERAVKYKASTVKNGNGISEAAINDAPYQKLKINFSITLSVRATAKLFDITISAAHLLLKKIDGLTIKQNRVKINKETFQHCLNTGSPNIRYDNGQYIYVKAQTPILSKFISIVENRTQGQPYYLSDNW
jgi:hypothetical protein